MSISLSQIHSVLKNYERQLKQGKVNSSDQKRDKAREPADIVTISSEAKRRQLVDQILSQALDRYKVKGQKESLSDELPKQNISLNPRKK
jgi:hypothetical protein